MGKSETYFWIIFTFILGFVSFVYHTITTRVQFNTCVEATGNIDGCDDIVYHERYIEHQKELEFYRNKLTKKNEN